MAGDLGHLGEALLGRFPDHDLPFLPDESPGEDGRRSLALVLAYDGAGFEGWQVQPQARTIQGEVEAALSKLCDHPVRLAASGRTDAGVHALGQAAAFHTTSLLSLERMERGLGALLPQGIHLRALGPVEPGFHPRFDAKAKTYHYHLWPGAEAPLFLRHRLWALEHPLEAGPVEEALALLEGEHDLKAFASGPLEVKGTTVRRVLAARLERHPAGLWRVELTATGFLRHVVRNLVGTLSQIGAGRPAPADLTAMLAAGQRLHPGPKAPPEGLYLAKVYYQSQPV